MFFTAFTPSTGLELWSSDGSPGGTALVADLAPGNGSSVPQYLVAIGTTVFFAASAPATGQELWRADGPSTVSLVKDIGPGPTGSRLRYLIDAADTLFFVAFEPGTGWALWKSDGTESGPVQVKVLGTAADPRNLTAAGGRLLFTSVDDASGRELWTSDGTEAGTKPVKDLASGSGELVAGTGDGGWRAPLLHADVAVGPDQAVSRREQWASEALRLDENGGRDSRLGRPILSANLQLGTLACVLPRRVCRA